MQIANIEIAILVAFVVISTFVFPIVMAQIQDRKRVIERTSDYERQDAVAEQAKKAAALLLEQQENTALLLKDNNRVVAEAAAAVKGDLTAIHTLVNSDRTSGMMRELALLIEVAELRRAAGSEPSTGMLDEIKKLRTMIEERQVAAAVVDRQQAEDAELAGRIKRANQEADRAAKE